jgi:hypothetical protein
MNEAKLTPGSKVVATGALTAKRLSRVTESCTRSCGQGVSLYESRVHGAKFVAIGVHGSKAVLHGVKFVATGVLCSNAPRSKFVATGVTQDISQVRKYLKVLGCCLAGLCLFPTLSRDT